MTFFEALDKAYERLKHRGELLYALHAELVQGPNMVPSHVRRACLCARRHRARAQHVHERCGAHPCVRKQLAKRVAVTAAARYRSKADAVH